MSKSRASSNRTWRTGNSKWPGVFQAQPRLPDLINPVVGVVEEDLVSDQEQRSMSAHCSAGTVEVLDPSSASPLTSRGGRPRDYPID